MGVNKLIFEKSDAQNIIFYNGKNKQEVIDFFMQERTKHYGQRIVIDGDDLIYECSIMYKSSKRQELLPNHYITFAYDEDYWWMGRNISPERFKKDFIKVTNN